VTGKGQLGSQIGSPGGAPAWLLRLSG